MPAVVGAKETVARERERKRKYQAKKSATGRDIGRLPPVIDPRRKSACRFSLKLFALTYFPKTFDKPFSDDHNNVIEIMERAIVNGGLFCLAMPRGSGKTSLAIVAALWAILYGYHLFVLLVGATAPKARELLVTVKTELTTNDLLLADFPEALYPIRCLEGIVNRSKGQRFNGQPTHMEWTATQIILPTIPGSQASGAILRVAGIMAGNIRGQHYRPPGGGVLRPSLAIPDDPQTDHSAKSVKQSETRERVIKQAILGSAGPGKKMTVIMPCTVIFEGDLADRMLNRQLHPEWNGLRTKTLYSFPSDMKLWEEYQDVRADSLRRGNEGREATAFYKQHRKAMEAGAHVAWPANFKDDELSALESAMKKFLDDRFGFAAEHQNEPIQAFASVELRVLSAIAISEKLNHTPRGELPQFVSLVNAGIDVSQDVLWWSVCGWSGEFDGAIVDYGTWPDQGRSYFTLTDLARTIADELGDDFASLDEQLYEALDRCTKMLMAREFHRGDGAVLRLSREIIDAGFETKTVKRFCRQSPSSALLLASHGRGVTAKEKPISQWAKKEGQKRGEEWVIGKSNDVRGLRHLTFDTNHWKTQVHKRLSTSLGGRGSLSLCGDRPVEHRMMADHLAAEKPVLVKAKGREVVEWELPPNKPDNHWLDCIEQCAVGASIDGSEIFGRMEPPPKPPRQSRRGRVGYL